MCRCRLEVSRLAPLLLGVGAVTMSVASAMVHAQAVAARPAVPGAPAGRTAFVNVTVIPMDTERLLREQTVLVDRGRIAVLGPRDQVVMPADVTRIDGRGKYLLPGFGDCHVHLGNMKQGRQVSPTAAVAAAERRLFVWLADGVTTVQNLDFFDVDDAATIGLSEWFLNGNDVLRLRARAAAGELWSPRIYTAGQWVPLRHTPEYASHMAKRGGPVVPVPSLDSVIAYLTAYTRAGYDVVKVHSELEVMFDTVLIAARKVGIPIAAHVGGHRRLDGTTLLEKALAGGVRSIEHLSGYPRPTAITQAEMRTLAAATARAGVWNCITGMSKLGYLRSLQDAGAGLLLGTDAPLASSIHVMLDAMVTKGKLTPYEALETGTKNIATHFRALDDEGTIAVGKRADLVLLAGNPLENIRNTRTPAGVMIGGRWMARDELDRRLALIVASGGVDPSPLP